MPAQAPAPTLAELQAQMAEIERQKAVIQLPVLQAVKTRLEQADIGALIAELTEASVKLDTEHRAQVGYIITTLTNVPSYVAGAVTRLDAIVNPPVVPTPPAPEG